MPHKQSNESISGTDNHYSISNEQSVVDQIEAIVAHYEKLGLPIEQYPVDSDIIKQLDLSRLPKGVGIIGGAARAIFQRSVLSERAMVRDIDLALIYDLIDDDVDTDTLSQRYMPDDDSYGHGIDYIDQDDYFLTRDFTINEVLVIGNQILITKRGADDLQNKVIRPSSFDYTVDETYGNDFDDEEDGNYYEDVGLSAKLKVKGLLMKAVFMDQYGVGSIEGYGIEPYDDIPNFFIALGLNKAFQYGEVVTDKFIRELIAVGLVDEMYLNSPIELAENLLDSVYNFEYRGSDMADELYRTYEPWVDMWHDMPEPFEEEEAHAIDLWERYSRKLQGADITEYR